MFKSTPLLNMIECFDIDYEDKLNKRVLSKIEKKNVTKIIMIRILKYTYDKNFMIMINHKFLRSLRNLYTWNFIRILYSKYNIQIKYE